jgi:hypothetical protein
MNGVGLLLSSVLGWEDKATENPRYQMPWGVVGQADSGQNIQHICSVENNSSQKKINSTQ